MGRMLVYILTAIIDKLNYKGTKYDDNQLSEFPRNFTLDENDNPVIPEEVRIATALIALKLLEGVQPELEFNNARVTSDSIASVKTTYNVDNTPEHMFSGVPSYDAWVELSPYLREGKDIPLVRVN